jgi:UDP-GlcNAc3NAcA epimerase
MKIATLVGARPQFVKAATVVRAIASHSDIRHVLIHTGQHYDANMSDVFFAELDIPKPQHNLDIGSGKHGEQTGRMLNEVEEVLLQEKPDWVLVYGDTNSTIAGALAAVKLHIPVAHVESGLRSFNRRMPEEINRVLTDHTSDVLFAPTDSAVANLAKEGLTGSKVVRTGDVMYDAALHYASLAEKRSKVLHTLGLTPRNFTLATLHRAENTDQLSCLKNLLLSLDRVAQTMPVVLPVHPRTRGVLAREASLAALTKKIRVVDPVGYLDMNMLERHARLVMTDSGGVQKEAFFARVPCVTLREETEWVELVEGGYNRIAGTNPDRIASAVEAALASTPNWDSPLYGDGKAAYAIIEHLQQTATESVL